ncbi:hypothetical protein [Rhizobium sp. EC-SD404]|uniref:hypothetical protein n=1 Tax=Rhizobium sp. EC-SD404 TaxID=2038389 RepID=UPI0018FF057B|nr:hypothetical protein [Rhizobium sp. EC-SD404]
MTRPGAVVTAPMRSRFADLEYVATNDNGGMSTKKAAVYAFASIAMSIAGLYWLLS